MNTENEKAFASYVASIKEQLTTNFNEDIAIKYVQWMNKKIVDTIADKKEKEILRKLKSCDAEEATRLRKIKVKYLPPKYPTNLKIGDVIHISFGFGYCSELSGGHYAIILSEMIANMYLVLPISSEPLKKFNCYIEGLSELPCKYKKDDNKKSHLRFDQLRHVHYRRIERINDKIDRVNIGENIKYVFQKLNEYVSKDIDKIIKNS